LQARDRRDDDAKTQVGYTASKKIGNAVLRNRAKRRLREAARAVMPGLARPGWDYVLVARPQATVSRPFDDLKRDLQAALAAVHAKP
jgi:ribonuclease P protein component